MLALQVVHPNTGTAGDVGPGTAHPPGTSGSAVSADSGRAGRSRQTTLHHHHHPLQGIGAGGGEHASMPARQHAPLGDLWFWAASGPLWSIGLGSMALWHWFWEGWA